MTFDDVQLKKGLRELKAIVDAKSTVTESNESNNRDELQVNCRED